jgi:hypothetical protein
LRDRNSGLESLDARVYAVSFEPPERVRAFIGREPQPFGILSDVERKGYEAFGFGELKGVELLKVANWNALCVYAEGMLHGHHLRFRPHQIAQLGGDVVVDPRGVVTFIHASEDPGDRPRPEVLVDALRRAAGSPVG